MCFLRSAGACPRIDEVVTPDVYFYLSFLLFFINNNSDDDDDDDNSNINININFIAIVVVVSVIIGL